VRVETPSGLSAVAVSSEGLVRVGDPVRVREGPPSGASWSARQRGVAGGWRPVGLDRRDVTTPKLLREPFRWLAPD